MEGTVDVFVAASLAGVVQTIASDFEAANPGVTVRLSPAGSASLVTQVREEAPVDILITADEQTMDGLLSDGTVATVGTPTALTTNTLALIAAPGNPGGVESLEDAASDDVLLVVCAPQVPCGAATQQLSDLTGVTFSPVSEETSVTDVLAKVTSGQADAGLVYVTDVRAALAAAAEAGRDPIIDVPLPAEASSIVTRSVAVEFTDTASTRAFFAALTSESGRAAFAAAGFGAP